MTREKTAKPADSLLLDSPFPWWEWRVSSNTVTASPWKVGILGYGHEDFAGKGYQAYTDLLHSDDYERAMKAMRDLLEGKAPIYQVDYRIITADGTYHWYMDRGAVIEELDDGRPELVRGIVIDLGEHVKHDSGADQLVALLRSAVPSDRTTERVLRVCSSCKRIRSDDAWIEISDDLSQFIALPQSHGICPDCLQRLYPDIASEVTAKVKLEKLNRLKDQFLGMAVHDMRNPLNLISLYVELLRKEIPGNLNDEQHELMRKIGESSAFLKQLISDFLVSSVVESGKLQLNRRPTDMRSVIESSLTFIGTVAAKKKITVTVDIQENLPPVDCDAQKMCQVINNLLTNAVHYSLSETSVALRCSGRDNSVLIAITDQGPGLSPEEIKRIFIPFERAAAGSNREGGIGLGLAITKKIVDAHNGSIEVESAEGTGSTFTVRIPVT